MNKLTAEECRLLINGLSGNRSIREDKYLAALEIALPVLEQQESPTDTYRQIENDGWIEWRGGNEAPKINRFLEVQYKRSGTGCGFAKDFDWEQTGAARDIIAYRVIENDGREG